MNYDLTRFKIKDYKLTAFEGILIQYRDLIVPEGRISLEADGLVYVLDYVFVPDIGHNEDGQYINRKSDEMAQWFIDMRIKKTGVVDLTKWLTHEQYIKQLEVRL